MGSAHGNYNYRRMALTSEQQEEIWGLFSEGKNIHQITDQVGAAYSSVDMYLTLRLKENNIGSASNKRSNDKVPRIIIPPRKPVSRQQALEDYNYRVFIDGHGVRGVINLSESAIENEIVATFNPKTYKG